MTIFVNDRDFYRKLGAIAIPIALQNLITVGVSMADTLMLGALGEVQLSSASIANQLLFMLTILGFGLSGGANVLMAQYWGKGDLVRMRSIMSLVYKISLGMSLIFAFLALFCPQMVMSIFTTDPQVIEGGCEYLRIIGFTYPLYALSNNGVMLFRSSGKVRISVVVYSFSLVVNVFFNWVLIFGNLGAPRMEIAGAALATSIARVCEFVIIAVYTLWVEKDIRFRLKDLLGIDREILQDFIRNATPILFNEFLWSSGASVVAIVIGRMGREFVSANSINTVVMQLASVAITGLANAAAAVIGNTIGEGDIPKAKERARTLVFISFIVGIIAGTIIFVVRPYVVSLYNITELTRGYTMSIMGITSVLVFFQSITMITMIGVLRGGGDGRFVLVLDIFFMWTIAIPLGFCAGLVWGLPVPLVFLLLKCDEMLKSFFSIHRIFKGDWIRDVTR